LRTSAATKGDEENMTGFLRRRIASARIRGRVLRAGKAAVLAPLATLLLATVPGPVFAQAAEACPGATVLAAEFAWSGSAWTASGGSAGISVWGDSSLARWSATGNPVSAVVVTAGTTTINYAYDPVATNGAVASTDVESAAGASLSNLGFCTGAPSTPSSGSKISVGITKTAACAIVNADQSATVKGTITVVRHRPQDDPNAPSHAIRVRTTRDTVFAAGAMLGETTSIAGLSGVVMPAGTDTVTVPYQVSFDPGTAVTFSNKIEITIEEAVSGLDRHKYYAAFAAFSLCSSATPTPTPTPEGSVKAATGSPSASVPNTEYGSAPVDSSSPNTLFFALVLFGSSTSLALVAVRQRGGRRRRR
jgi:hypothetical protein